MAGTQRLVGPHFEATADNWRELYEREDIYARIYQSRRDAVLQWVDSLALPAGTSVLEVGCGPGLTAVELALRGHAVTAVDIAPAMISMTRKLAAEKEVSVRTLVGDVCNLPFPNDTFSLVLSMGVVEWIPKFEGAIHALARTLAPGGNLIVTTDNEYALNRLLDPLLNPVLEPFKRFLRNRAPKARPGVHSVGQFDAAIKNAGLQIVASRTLGFGPFTFFKFPAMPRGLSIRLDRHLQDAADRGAALLRERGHIYAVLARKQHGAG